MNLDSTSYLAAAASLAAALLINRAARAAEPIRTLDLRSLYGSAPTDIQARRQAYDTLVAASCVQGIANRKAPNLYLYWGRVGRGVIGGFSNPTPPRPPTDPDVRN